MRPDQVSTDAARPRGTGAGRTTRPQVTSRPGVGEDERVGRESSVFVWIVFAYPDRMDYRACTRTCRGQLARGPASFRARRGHRGGRGSGGRRGFAARRQTAGSSPAWRARPGEGLAKTAEEAGSRFAARPAGRALRGPRACLTKSSGVGGPRGAVRAAARGRQAGDLGESGGPGRGMGAGGSHAGHGEVFLASAKEDEAGRESAARPDGARSRGAREACRWRRFWTCERAAEVAARSGPGGRAGRLGREGVGSEGAASGSARASRPSGGSRLRSPARPSAPRGEPAGRRQRAESTGRREPAGGPRCRWTRASRRAASASWG